MDVTALVKNITSAFEDASALVTRIRKRRADENASEVQLEPIDDLLDSLSLGPTVVRGYYESDAKRFGGRYMAGDAVAREQLKDALINLQMTVLSSLGTVIFSDREPDYGNIQAASDDCRVNVGVCLGQLSQRMSKAIRESSHGGRVPMYDTVQSNPMQRSNSRSTQSSGYTRAIPMTPPESDTEFLDMGRSLSQRQQSLFARPPDLDATGGMHMASYTNGFYKSTQDNGQITFKNSLVMPIPKGLESPISPQDPNHPTSPRGRESSISNSTTSSQRLLPSSRHVPLVQESPWSANAPNDIASGGYFGASASEIAASTSNDELTSATLGRPRTSSNSMTVNRKPINPTTPNTTSWSPGSLQPYSHYPRSSIPEDEKEAVVIPPPTYNPPSIPNRSVTRTESYPRSASTTTTDTVQRGSNMALQRLSTGPLNLPTDKNLLGFCKGAFRLQAGLEKKAFVLAKRPLGYSSMLEYWKCDKCYFEGMCRSDIPPGAKKPEKLYDPTIRDHSGIRYKWAFLARSHVPLKSMPEGRRDGLYGSFGCIFCTAEASQRGWPNIMSTKSADRASLRSSSSGQSATSTAVFGSIHALMDHLQVHREEEFWPCVEMQGRMKCVVGRIAQRGEEFDINLLPIA